MIGYNPSGMSQSTRCAMALPQTAKTAPARNMTTVTIHARVYAPGAAIILLRDDWTIESAEGVEATDERDEHEQLDDLDFHDA